MWMEVSGTSIRLTPAATDARASPLASPVAARWVATMDDEHAVSMPMHGPAGRKGTLLEGMRSRVEGQGATCTSGQCLRM